MKTISIALLSIAVFGISSLSAQTFETPKSTGWYRLTTRYNGTDLRTNRCIQLSTKDSDHAGMLWSADPVTPADTLFNYQMWTFIPSDKNTERYKMVCKADSLGFVNPKPTADNASARWKYVYSDEDASDIDPYGFIFVIHDDLSGVDSDDVSYCALASDSTINNYYCLMNCGSSKQDYAINLWSDDYSEDANEWLFRFEEYRDFITDVKLVTPEPESTSKVYYDLWGRAFTDPKPGFYIHNGKKIIIR